ncbi:MAG: hypothetical protein V4553_15790 [Bacteroidota bacterium]
MPTVKQSLKIRKQVLLDSLYIESLIGHAASLFLGISNAKTSNCFGNTSKALSFNQKIFLLIDVGALDNNTTAKFLKFMEIRNQFVHNIDAISFENCLDNINGAENYLIKQYPSNIEESKELKLGRVYKELVSEIIKIIKDLHKKLEKKSDNDFDLQASVLLNDYYQGHIEVLIRYYDLYISLINRFSSCFELADLEHEIRDNIKDQLNKLEGLTIQNFIKRLDSE